MQEELLMSQSSVPSAANCAAEHLVQTLQSLQKLSLPHKTALQELIMQYRHTALDSIYSPSELLNGQQICSNLNALLPLPAHVAQGNQMRKAAKDQQRECRHLVLKIVHLYYLGEPYYTLF